MIGLAIRLALGGKAIIASAFAWVTQSMTRILAVLLVLALLWGLIERNSRIKAEKVLASTETAYRNAQKDAELAQDALNSSISARYRAEAEKSSATHRIALDGAHRAVSDYAGRMRCKADQGSASGTSAPALPDNPGLDADGSGEASMVAVTVADLDQLAAGTVRAESCRAWGQSMIDAGLAVSDMAD